MKTSRPPKIVPKNNFNLDHKNYYRNKLFDQYKDYIDSVYNSDISPINRRSYNINYSTDNNSLRNTNYYNDNQNFKSDYTVNSCNLRGYISKDINKTIKNDMYCSQLETNSKNNSDVCCLLCDGGHSFEDCEQANKLCKFCSSSEHIGNECPDNICQRCGKENHNIHKCLSILQITEPQNHKFSDYYKTKYPCLKCEKVGHVWHECTKDLEKLSRTGFLKKKRGR